MNLKNEFKLAGNIAELKISLTESYAKCLFALMIDNHTPIQLSYFCSRRYNEAQYKKLNEIINKISTKFDSYVYIGNEKYFNFPKENLNRLYAMGSLSTDGKRIFFNANYIEMANDDIDNFLSIHLDGQWVGQYDFLTIQNDRPLIFHIKKVNTSDDIVSCAMSYHSGYDVIEDTLCNADSGLFPIYFSNTGNHIENIDRWLLEWNIINEEN